MNIEAICEDETGEKMHFTLLLSFFNFMSWNRVLCFQNVLLSVKILIDLDIIYDENQGCLAHIIIQD
jgi:hypothetical protein